MQKEDDIFERWLLAQSLWNILLELHLVTDIFKSLNNLI